MGKYLYNGVELPQLPEWDRKTYPYVLICYKTEPNYTLYFSTTPFYRDYLVQNSSEGAAYIQYGYDSVAQEWTYSKTVESSVQLLTSVTLLWANHDIIEQSTTASVPQGTIILAGSEYTIPPKEPEPIAYLYNGVQLPALPEWDKTVYPYAFITGVTTNDKVSYYLYCTETQLSHDGRSMGAGGVWFVNIYATLQIDGVDVDSPVMSGPRDTASITARELIWANYDVYKTDGSLHLAASEPVPVGGEPEPDEPADDGSFTARNKILPGAYIKFVNRTR